MLCKEIIAICTEIYTKDIVNTLCGQNVEFLNVKPGGTRSSHWAFKSYVLRLKRICQNKTSYTPVDNKWPVMLHIHSNRLNTVVM
jgi:hypothetical protein